jgi:hypothetical protein
VWGMREEEMEFLGIIKKPQDINDKASDLYANSAKRDEMKKL